MGKTDGFLLYQREEESLRSPSERIKDYGEFHIPLDPKDRKLQAGRCMNCGVPFCQSAIRIKGKVTGCPLHSLIPEWNDEIWHGNLEHALSRLTKKNPFPEFTGRVCPALCEKACTCGVEDEPVTIHENEFYIIESAFAAGMMKPHIPAMRSGKKVAVIGSGPAGLSAADRLNQRGHSVTVYEREHAPGGLLMYGIPNMKLDKKVITRRIDLMKAEGISFVCGVDVGKDISSEEILKQYDAIVLACGAKQARTLPQTEGCGQVFPAVTFLTEATRSVLDPEHQPAISAGGKHVIIVGGGDTGNDCVATCIRQHAASVTQLEMMPSPPRERRRDNPWPEWPDVQKTDYGQQEAIAIFGSDPRIYRSTIHSLITDKEGNLAAAEVEQGSFIDRKWVTDEGSIRKLPCELLIIAAGFTGCESYVPEAFSIELGPRHTVKTEPGSYRTSVPGVFTAGDMHRGQSLVVWAIEEGRECAREVDQALMGYTNLD